MQARKLRRDLAIIRQMSSSVAEPHELPFGRRCQRDASFLPSEISWQVDNTVRNSPLSVHLKNR